MLTCEGRGAPAQSPDRGFGALHLTGTAKMSSATGTHHSVRLTIQRLCTVNHT